jgi:hypothetical protein
VGIWIDSRPMATEQKTADECLVSVGRSGSTPLVFPREYANQLMELVTALQTASLCECVIHGCAERGAQA